MNPFDTSARHLKHILRCQTQRRSQRAFTLLEAVLAILIVTSAGIGIAALYAHSDNVAHGGKLHRRAIELTNSIAESIRAQGDTKGNFETRIGQTCVSTAQEKTKKVHDAIAHQVACWQDEVATQLANGSSQIELDMSVMPSAYVVEVSWSEPRTGTASYVVRVPLSVTGGTADTRTPTPQNR